MTLEDEIPGLLEDGTLVDELAVDAELRWARSEAYRLLDELDVGSTSVRRAMLADPERAVLILEHARNAVGLRNPAAFAVKRWRSGYDPRRARSAPEPVRELEPEAPPTLSAIEYAWSLEPGSAPILAMMSSSIGRTGGFRPVLEAGFHA